MKNCRRRRRRRRRKIKEEDEEEEEMPKWQLVLYTDFSALCLGITEVIAKFRKHDQSSDKTFRRKETPHSFPSQTPKNTMTQNILHRKINLRLFQTFWNIFHPVHPTTSNLFKHFQKPLLKDPLHQNFFGVSPDTAHHSWCTAPPLEQDLPRLRHLTAPHPGWFQLLVDLQQILDSLEMFGVQYTLGYTVSRVPGSQMLAHLILKDSGTVKRYQDMSHVSKACQQQRDWIAGSVNFSRNLSCVGSILRKHTHKHTPFKVCEHAPL